MILSFTKKIWFYRDIVDFRKQLNGLIQLIVDDIGANPSSGELFIFRDRTGKKLKMIYFDGRCFWLLYCRLEEGKFKLPQPNDASLSITYDQLNWLLSGLTFDAKDIKPPNQYKHYF